MMAFVDMEDLYGTVEVVVFPNVYERYGALTTEDSIISVAGTINFKEGEVPKLLANRITDIRALGELAADDGADGSGAGGSWKGAGGGQNGSCLLYTSPELSGRAVVLGIHKHQNEQNDSNDAEQYDYEHCPHTKVNKIVKRFDPDYRCV